MIRLLLTDDGSYTLKNEEMDETYHSTKGALTESLHVFVEQGMMHHWRQHHKPLRILEVGFGTGLNALLTFEKAAQEGIAVEYVGLEPYPIPEELVQTLASSPDFLSESSSQLLLDLHEMPWESIFPVKNDGKLQKLQMRLEDFEAEAGSFDIVYFDAFAPKKQPEIWQLPVLAKCWKLLKKSGVLVTYSASGQFKRDLKFVNFRVEKVQGPLGGKREMTRAIKEEYTEGSPQ